MYSESPSKKTIYILRKKEESRSPGSGGATLCYEDGPPRFPQNINQNCQQILLPSISTQPRWKTMVC